MTVQIRCGVRGGPVALGCHLKLSVQLQLPVRIRRSSYIREGIKMLEIKGKVNTAIAYAKVIEEMRRQWRTNHLMTY